MSCIKDKEIIEDAASTQLSFACDFETAIKILKKNIYDRTPRELEALASYLADNKFFQTIEHDHGVDVCRQLMGRLKYEQKSEGRIVYKAGDQPYGFFIILKGKVHFKVEPKYATKTEIFEPKNESVISDINEIQAGSSFGESALFSEKPRHATYICKSECHFAMLTKSDYKIILAQENMKKVQNKIDEISTFSIFNEAGKNTLATLVCSLTIDDYSQNKILFKEGEEANYVYFIKSGEFKLTKDIYINFEADHRLQPFTDKIIFKTKIKRTVELAIFGPGEILGLEDVMADRKRETSLTCLSLNGSAYVIHKTALDSLIYLIKTQDLKKNLCGVANEAFLHATNKFCKSHEEWFQKRIEELRTTTEENKKLLISSQTKLFLNRDKIMASKTEGIKVQSPKNQNKLCQSPTQNELKDLKDHPNTSLYLTEAVEEESISKIHLTKPNNVDSKKRPISPLLKRLSLASEYHAGSSNKLGLQNQHDKKRITIEKDKETFPNDEIQFNASFQQEFGRFESVINPGSNPKLNIRNESNASQILKIHKSENITQVQPDENEIHRKPIRWFDATPKNDDDSQFMGNFNTSLMHYDKKSRPTSPGQDENSILSLTEVNFSPIIKPKKIKNDSTKTQDNDFSKEPKKFEKKHFSSRKTSIVDQSIESTISFIERRSQIIQKLGLKKKNTWDLINFTVERKKNNSKIKTRENSAINPDSLARDSQNQTPIPNPINQSKTNLRKSEVKIRQQRPASAGRSRNYQNLSADIRLSITQDKIMELVSQKDSSYLLIEKNFKEDKDLLRTAARLFPTKPLLTLSRDDIFMLPYKEKPNRNTPPLWAGMRRNTSIRYSSHNTPVKCRQCLVY